MWLLNYITLGDRFTGMKLMNEEGYEHFSGSWNVVPNCIDTTRKNIGLY